MPIVVLGHRGMGPTSRSYPNQFLPYDVIPENSLLAFQSAIDNGAQGIELDVYATNDNIVVVARDDVLDRNIDGYHSCWTADEKPRLGKISEKNFLELQDRRYDLGHKQRIPKLTEVIDLIIENNRRLKSRNILINIELQGDNFELAKYVWQIITCYVNKQENELSFSDFVINSFNMQHLIKFREAQAGHCKWHEIELMIGVYTSLLFGKEDLLPGWVPVLMQEGKPVLDNNQLPIPKNFVDITYAQDLINRAKKYNINYLDIVSADLRGNLLELCMLNDMHVAMSCNLIRVRAESDLWFNFPANKKQSDIELEQLQLQQIYLFAQQYPDRKFYYKADNVAEVLRFLDCLEQNYSSNMQKNNRLLVLSEKQDSIEKIDVETDSRKTIRSYS